ncbi:MAG: PspC domain-containing protein [Clostridium sp.]
MANALEIHSSWVRIGFILSIIFGGAGIIAYILLDIALEKEPN